MTALLIIAVAAFVVGALIAFALSLCTAASIADHELERLLNEEFPCRCGDTTDGCDRPNCKRHPGLTHILKATGDEPIEVVNSGAEDWVD